MYSCTDSVLAVYPTVADVLATHPVQIGAPRVRAGADALDRAVRWVHVSEISAVAGTLEGGELLLSTGIVAADTRIDHAAYVTALWEAEVSGLVIELGPLLPQLPEAMVRTARRLGVPLIELHRTVRFVEITEVVHARILNAQHERLQYAQQVNQVFTTLSVEGAKIDEVLAQAGALGGCPVVLEDLAHHAVAFGGPAAASELLRDWEKRSRLAASGSETAIAGPERWMCTPVGPRRRRWGRLVVPRVPSSGGADQLAMVLERAADTLAIGRLVQGDSQDVALQAHGGLLQELLVGPITDERALRSRMRALGLRIGRAYAVLVVAVPARPSAETDHAVLDAAATTARGQGLAALTGLVGPGRIAVVFSCQSEAAEPAAVDSFVAALRADQRVPAALIAAAAAPATRLAGLSTALAEAAQVANVAAAGAEHRPVHRSATLGARGLLWSLRDDPRLAQFTELQLRPLLTRDAERSGDLVDLLRAYLEVNGNTAELARRLHLSRPAVYGRLKQLTAALGADLTAAQTRLSLQLALLAYDQARLGRTARG